jgi:hypothetical protein
MPRGDLADRVRAIEERMRGLPARWAGGGGVAASFRWLRIDGGQTLRASPLSVGLKNGTLPAQLPDDLDPGAVDATTGVETVAASGTFPDGCGFGVLVTQPLGGSATYTRVMLRNISPEWLLSGWLYWNVTTSAKASTDPGITYTLYHVGF